MAPAFTLPLMLGSIPKPRSNTHGDSSAVWAVAFDTLASRAAATTEKHRQDRITPLVEKNQ